MQHHSLTAGSFVIVSVGIEIVKDKRGCFILSLEGEEMAKVFTISNAIDLVKCLCKNPGGYQIIR